ncbi:hypothetical protein ACFWC5_23595 [Streptomyces sp. NPDC060085]|uniref:hypothetical protein n=1 Tax=Streptomyces sp. NPDC060085 TaxID=3347054 RepID=UPI00364A784A
MTAEDADAQIALDRGMGEVLAEQEYTSTDRASRPMRIILQIGRPEAHQGADLGVVYEYSL